MNGTKYDNGKPKVDILFEDMPRALMEVAKVSTFGANKYARSNWLKVPDAINRYSAAAARHKLNQHIEGDLDSESGLHHLAHEAWNILAVLELKLRNHQEQPKKKRWVLRSKRTGKYWGVGTGWVNEVKDASHYYEPDAFYDMSEEEWIEV